MPQTNAAQTSNVTIIPPRPDNLHEAIDALHTAQITGEYRYTALAMAGALISEIGAIFPMHMILIYMATSSKRRQIWHSYIAAMYSNPTDPQPISNPDAVRKKLMNTGSKKLLQEAYGSVPEGMIQALGRLGLNGEEPRIYLLLQKFMEVSPLLRKSLSHTSKIEASTIIALAALPESLKDYELAKLFRDPEDIKTLLFMIDTLAQSDDVKYAELCAKVVNAAKHGHSLSSVLKSAYHDTLFASPAVRDSDHCRHIYNSFELKKTAKQFRNCLSDYCDEAIRGEYQYYRWYENNRPVAVISLREDAPYGWRIDEIFGKRNEYICDELEQKIIHYFESHGVHKMVSMEAMLRELGGMLKRGHRRDPVDEINDVIDELLGDGSV